MMQPFQLHACGAQTYLIDEVLCVFIREFLLGLEDLVEVCVHQLVHDVEISQISGVNWHHDIMNADDVFVFEVPEQLDFSDGSLGIREVEKDLGDFLDGSRFSRTQVFGRADHPIRSASDGSGEHVPVFHLKRGAPHVVPPPSLDSILVSFQFLHRRT